MKPNPKPPLIDPDLWERYAEWSILCHVEGCGWEGTVHGSDEYAIEAKSLIAAHFYDKHPELLA